MDEAVLAAILGRDEAEALLGAVPGDRAGFHGWRRSVQRSEVAI